MSSPGFEESGNSIEDR